MARAKYVYTLYRGCEPLAHFTVKHEAVRYWVNKLARDPEITMTRAPDGASTDKAVLVEGWQT